MRVHSRNLVVIVGRKSTNLRLQHRANGWSRLTNGGSSLLVVGTLIRRNVANARHIRADDREVMCIRLQ